jgi:hypothetical protein
MAGSSFYRGRRDQRDHYWSDESLGAEGRRDNTVVPLSDFSPSTAKIHGSGQPFSVSCSMTRVRV